MNDRTDEIKDKIIQLLREHGEMFTKEIAGSLGMSSATTSKYLLILRAEGVIIKSDDRKPYTYWRLKDNKNSK